MRGILGGKPATRPDSMPGQPFARRFVSFGEFEADLQLGRIFKRGVKVKLREQSFQVLASLLEHPGQVVTREDLRRRLWPGHVFVDFENSLNTAIGRLRASIPEGPPRSCRWLGAWFSARRSEAGPR